MSDTEEVAAVEEVAEMSVLDALREVRNNHDVIVSSGSDFSLLSQLCLGSIFRPWSAEA